MSKTIVIEISDESNAKIKDRQIAFRAWDSERNMMITSRSRISLSHGKWGISEKNSDTYSPLHGFIMQYTGLKDKNGKEIYEEDIVTFIHQNGHSSTRRIVWDEELAAFMYSDEGANSYLGGTRNKLEVTGNIYENPELLK